MFIKDEGIKGYKDEGIKRFEFVIKSRVIKFFCKLYFLLIQ